MRQRIYEALLTGVPYGVFKLQTGWLLTTEEGAFVGYVLMLMGVVDLGLNLAGVFKPSPFPLCTFVVLGRFFSTPGKPRRYDEIALALDTLLSFLLVSGMIWFGAIGRLVPVFGRLWDVCVILNIVSVGVARVYASFRQESGKTLE